MREPPPRKTKLTQVLKTTQLEQILKLQSKHQQECDLLDDIRNFGKQRSQIEKDYGQALQKLVLQYQKKDWPLFSDTEDTDQVHVLTVWKSVLDATEKTAQARISGAENYKNSVYEAAKHCRTRKDMQLKKSQELLNTLHNETTETIKELTKAKKKYFELEQIATMARDKYQDVDDRLRKNQTSIFKSKAGLEKAFQKLQLKCDESNKASTVSRNEYLLMLGAANSHQERYYEVDLPEAMRVLDGNIFSKFQEYLTLLSQYELDGCRATEEAFVGPSQQTTQISREYNTRCFLRENPIFEAGSRYEFEACGEDRHGGKLIEEQPGDDNSLNREARKWTYRVERDAKLLIRLSRSREGLEALLSSNTQNRDQSDVTTQETEVRLQKCKQDIRKLETCRAQGEARLALLRETDVNVDTWIESAKAQIAKETPASSSTCGGFPSRKKSRTSSSEVPRLNGERFIASTDENTFDDSGDDFDETFDDESIEMEKDNLSIPSSDHSRNYPVTCTVSYAYQATRADELTIEVGTKIEVIEDGDLDQWVKARDKNGKVGYVPEYYLEFPMNPSNVSHHHYAQTPGEDYLSSLDSSYTTSAHGVEMNNNKFSNETSLPVQHGICLAKAIYEYEACTDEELSFPEGAIINVLSKDDSGVDDGWWKGELNGNVGVFPGLVVEAIGDQVNEAKPPADAHSSDDSPEYTTPPPNVRPPPPPANGTIDRRSPTTNFVLPRNTSWGGTYEATHRVNGTSDLETHTIHHERTKSAPSPSMNPQLKAKPHRSAPAPPQRPSSFCRFNECR